MAGADDTRVSVEKRGPLTLIGLDRASKRNAFDGAMMRAIDEAFAAFEADADAHVGVLFAHGDHFTGGVNLPEYAARWAKGENPLEPHDGMDALGLYSRPRTKPVISAIRGRCYTIGIELMLATDVRFAAESARFAQMEVQRGLYPVGGGTLRFVSEAGWGNAMLHLLTGDEFDAAEALRIGLVQKVVPTGTELDAAIAYAERVAQMAQAGVRATIVSSRTMVEGESFRKAVDRLIPDLVEVYKTEDAAEGVNSFLERRNATFSGR